MRQIPSDEILYHREKKIWQRRAIFGARKKHGPVQRRRFCFDQMARAPICMRPLAPGVPGFAYERVALTDFSLPSRIFVPLAILSLSLLTPLASARIYGLPAQRVASLTRR